MINAIDTVSAWAGRLAAWMFFAVGMMICYEVIMRHGFTLPTIWVDEVARIFQIWGTLIAGAYVLSEREHVVIDVAFKKPGTVARKLVDTFAMLVIIAVSAVVCWYGFELWLKAFRMGHTTDSFLAPPKWLTHGSLWVGFGLLLLQALAEIVKTWTGRAHEPEAHSLELPDGMR